MRRKTGLFYLITTIILLMIVICGVVIGCLKYIEKQNLPSGVYQCEVDITEQVLAQTALWLSEAYDDNFDLSAFEERLGTVVIVSEMTLEKTGTNTGNFSITVNQEMYDAAKRNVSLIVEQELTAVIADRLAIAGIDASKDTSEIIESALGMSLGDYMVSCDISFVPEYNEYLEIYAREGSYSIDGSQITWNSGGVMTVNTFARGDNMIIFTASENTDNRAMVYTLRQ